ncbi:unnamed protein product [Pleuronectes platessa]|uniref:Uncharacterized protein n=1 Tax=Pleuronectes platessa TaxID=8262 RepID=A0A9N7YLZ2_PLEPL|nr:unnamed protein product [Pleuronectes platessa]
MQMFLTPRVSVWKRLFRREVPRSLNSFKAAERPHTKRTSQGPLLTQGHQETPGDTTGHHGTPAVSTRLLCG